MRQPTLRATPEIALVAFLVVYILFAGSVANAPFQDLPNHLTRAHIIGDLLFNAGAVYGDAFYLKPGFSPYLIGDLVFALLDRICGPEWAARLWIAATITLLPCGVWFVLRVQEVSRIAAVTGAILAFYVATDWFFVKGFFNYQLSIACALCTYGWFLKARASNSWRANLCYSTLLIIGFALHLTALLFTIAIVGTSVGLSVLKRELSLSRAAVLLAPPGLLFALYLLFGHSGDLVAYQMVWITWRMKVLRLGSPVIRFDRAPELVLLGIVLVSLSVPIITRSLRATRNYIESLILALVFLALYFVMPTNAGVLYDVDNRALPYALVYVLLASVRASDASVRIMRLQFVGAVVIACANLTFLVIRVLPQNEALGRYKLIARDIPAGSKVLPVNTRPMIGRYEPFVHAGSYATLESAALTPYLFAGGVQSYFRYVNPESAPSIFWYGLSGYVNWEHIAKDYQYLLVTLPWETSRIPLTYRLVRSNETVALLEIQGMKPP